LYFCLQYLSAGDSVDAAHWYIADVVSTAVASPVAAFDVVVDDVVVVDDGVDTGTVVAGSAVGRQESHPE